MQLELRTRNVFIDTSIFRAANFNFRSTAFRTLTELARQHRLFVKISDITQNEVEAQLRALVEEAVQELNRFRSKAYILRNLRSPQVRQLFEPLDANASYQELLDQFRSFVLDANLECIVSDAVSPGRVFNKYFLLRPPFGDGKKKSEFPDAFVIEALLQWCEKNDAAMFVISSDNDLKNACESEKRLIYAESLESILDLVIRFDAEVTAFDVLFEREVSRIKSAIRESFCHADISVKGSSFATIAEVESVVIWSRSVIGFDKQFAIMELLVDITYRADVFFPSEDLTGVPPSADEPFDTPYMAVNIEQAKTVPVEVQLQFAEIEPQYLHVDRVILNRGQPIQLDFGGDEDAETGVDA